MTPVLLVKTGQELPWYRYIVSNHLFILFINHRGWSKYNYHLGSCGLGYSPGGRFPAYNYMLLLLEDVSLFFKVRRVCLAHGSHWYKWSRSLRVSVPSPRRRKNGGGDFSFCGSESADSRRLMVATICASFHSTALCDYELIQLHSSQNGIPHSFWSTTSLLQPNHLNNYCLVP